MKKLTRREILKAAGVVALAPAACVRVATRPSAPSAPAGVPLNDVHSLLNPTLVERVATERTLESLRALVRSVARQGGAISVAGGRHAMGGQQFGEGTVNLDTRALSRVLSFDPERGLLEVEAGVQWPELIGWYLREQRGRERQWGIAQKQTGADRLCLGGALSANAHGRGLRLKPLVGDIESFRLVDARGDVHTCSRMENRELFSLAIGGYGLFGIVYSVTLRLKERTKVRRAVEVCSADGLAEAFEQRIRAGFTYGDFQFETDERSPSFLTRGVFACYEPVDAATPEPEGQRQLADEAWLELLYLGHADKRAAFERYSSYYLSTAGQIYWDDTQQLGFYRDDYHRGLDTRLAARTPGSEMISELYVPRPLLADFLHAAAERLREERASVIYGTVRLIERDDETFMPWAREPYACTVLNLHVEHTPDGIERAGRSFRALIDLARERAGSYFLTYHRWASREQVLACHPQFPEFLRLKRRYDPDELFQSEWYRHHLRLLG